MNKKEQFFEKFTDLDYIKKDGSVVPVGEAMVNEKASKVWQWIEDNYGDIKHWEKTGDVLTLYEGNTPIGTWNGVEYGGVKKDKLPKPTPLKIENGIASGGQYETITHDTPKDRFYELMKDMEFVEPLEIKDGKLEVKVKSAKLWNWHCQEIQNLLSELEMEEVERMKGKSVTAGLNNVGRDGYNTAVEEINNKIKQLCKQL